MSRNEEYVVFSNATVLRIAPSGKAMLIQVEDAESWLPLSQVMDGDSYGEGEQQCEIIVKAWCIPGKDIEPHAEPYEGEAYDEQHR